MIKGVHPSPVGPLTIVSDGQAIIAIVFDGHAKEFAAIAEALKGEDEVTRAARTQLDEYFAGTRRKFDLPLALRGPDFRQKVWRELARVRYGATTTYGALAQKIGAAKAARAVGAANGANPISIVIPCHRVIGSSGALTGYAGGLERKQFLLALEQRAGMNPLARAGAQMLRS